MVDLAWRAAVGADVAAIDALAARSIRALHAGAYPAAVIEEAVAHAYGVDWQLVRDATYFVATVDGALAGAGGWSFRHTIAGAHGPDDPAAAPLIPGRDAARLRAFYVDPAQARRGVGALLLGVSERAAAAAGFRHAELTATLPAIPFYAAFGYREVGDLDLPLPSGTALRLRLMRKPLAPATTIDEERRDHD
ncbi:GNAT family N-acetyltransferase [Sphingomonas sp. BK235]|jgi:GNAT superfamily N-acetyltransferase|uniref:GNAT family N-acetyltransferase n=1 Tax=Sphingomonas sp. BK235 TaxID=2512131 RepID=UPI0010453906|nr:GNAT family N-acetyltransferase [Sphingomonas sp. BK235]TCP36639.1 acetyltransferase (GNAT) family protein [Sphingomonas sp. BK235]